MSLIAALPMYDWHETRAETDALWRQVSAHLQAAGVPAPAELTREAPDLHALWRNPDLLLSQACWGPLEQGLADHVLVVGQPDYSDVEGGAGPDYSSVVLMRRAELDPQTPPNAVAAPADGQAVLPLPLLRNRRLAFNGPDSMSGRIALERDLSALGESLDLFSEQVESGGHRLSIRMLAAGQADVCAVDCRSWWLAQRFEPAARGLVPVGWTARRPGLPFVMAPRLAHLREAVRAALVETQLLRN